MKGRCHSASAQMVRLLYTQSCFSAELMRRHGIASTRPPGSTQASSHLHVLTNLSYSMPQVSDYVFAVLASHATGLGIELLGGEPKCTFRIEPQPRNYAQRHADAWLNVATVLQMREAKPLKVCYPS